MKIQRMSRGDGEALAAVLRERQELDGTFRLIQRPEEPERYFINPANGQRGEFRAIVGMDKKLGRITLLLNSTEAVVLLGATTRFWHE
jgi:hypothetical protein